MTIRVLHTSDWHLGHTLRDFSRAREHEAFLDWLVDAATERHADALLVAGDIFDTANPSAAALELFYRFLARVTRALPELDVVVIGGNHDSAARLDAPRALLDAMRVTIVGGLPPRSNGALPVSELVVPVFGSGGARALVCAVPFLRPFDLPRVETDGDELVEGVRAVYREVLDHARSVRAPSEPIIAMGHAYMVGGEVSELSERKVLGGNQHALPADLFGQDVAYVALGHLHRAQRVAGLEHVRYSGSPIPLSTTEASYKHQVRFVVLEGGEVTESEALPVPRRTDIVRIPEGRGAIAPDGIETACAALADAAGLERDFWPFLEIHVELDQPDPTLQERIAVALEGRAARLVRIVRATRGTGETLADTATEERLDLLSPEDVFRRRYSQDHGDEAEIPEALLAAFHEADDLAGQGGSA